MEFLFTVDQMPIGRYVVAALWGAVSADGSPGHDPSMSNHCFPAVVSTIRTLCRSRGIRKWCRTFALSGLSQEVSEATLLK